MSECSNSARVQRIVVIGGGVVGLSSALALSEALHARNQHTTFAVEVWRELRGQCPPHAMWEIPPYLIEPVSLATRWALDTLARLQSLSSAEANEAGLSTVQCVWLSRKHGTIEDQSQFGALLDKLQYRHSPQVLKELPVSSTVRYGYVDAASMMVPVLKTRDYLRYLERQLRERGVRLVQARVQSLESLAQQHTDIAMIFNCTGMAARNLAADPTMYPIKGQVVHVEAPWIRMALADMDTGAYVIPYPGETLECGGVSRKGDFDRKPRAEDTSKILNLVAEMVPSLSNAAAADTWSGFRPARAGGVRLEITRMKVPHNDASSRSVFVLHNYGHGGSGFTCSWGAATHATRLALDALGVASTTPKM